MTFSNAKMRAINILLFGLAPLMILTSCSGRVQTTNEPLDRSKTIRGVVFDQRGPIAGAVVRIQTTPYAATTIQDGSFLLPIPSFVKGQVNLTAWAKGYYIHGPIKAKSGQENIKFHLIAFTSFDNKDYRWLSSFKTGVQGENQGCEACHSSKGTNLPFYLPLDEWQLDAHSSSAINRRFLTMYSGTDIHGNRSQPTRYFHFRDYGTFPLKPKSSQTYYGPGYKLDFPYTAGNCAACHVPIAAVNDPYGTDPTKVTGVEKEGVNCDFCHKVWDIQLNPISGLPFENRPGVLSFEFRRPTGDHQLFIGPYDDVAPGEDTFSSLQRQSQFCAACHFGIFWDIVIYNSFGEWLASPYSDPETGKTCQDCHMPTSSTSHFARPDKGGLERDGDTIFSHRMPGAKDEKLLQNAVTLKAKAEVVEKEVKVNVSITNDQTGHHVPTDSPLRHLILLIRAVDEEGRPLAQTGGPILPDWCGIGDPAKGYYAGLPGKVFAKVLQEEWTYITPTGAYWNPTRLLYDNRIAAFCTDSSLYSFAVPVKGKITVKVSLIFRRAFKKLMDQKKWEVPDILMEQARIIVE